MNDTLIEQIKADAEGETQLIKFLATADMATREQLVSLSKHALDRILADAEEKARLHNTIAKLRGAEMKAQTITLSANQHSDFSEEENKALRGVLEGVTNWCEALIEMVHNTSVDPDDPEAFGEVMLGARLFADRARAALTSIGDSDE